MEEKLLLQSKLKRGYKMIEKMVCEAGKHKMLGPITICDKAPNQCPYEKSRVLDLGGGTRLYQCTCQGKIEKPAKKEYEEAILV
jgi:hypothetical protein